MPKRKFRQRLRDDSEEESQELESVLAEVAVPARARTKGMNVLATHDDEDDLKKVNAVSSGIKYHEDVMEKRLQEFVETNLEARFDTSLPDPLTRSNDCNETVLPEAESEQYPQHLLTPAVAEVSVPGFNTAITKVSLKSHEPNAPASVKGDRIGLSLEKRRSAPWVPRDLFPKRFGKSKEAISKRSRPE